MRDHYKTLGVARSADRKSIQRAYWERAKRCHPDKAGGDPALFRRLAEAYRVLTDPGERGRYDRRLADREGVAGFAAGVRGAAGFHSEGITAPVMDWSPMAAPGLLRLEVNLSLAEAAAGARVPVEAPTVRLCAGCKGTGWYTGCARCGGKGKVKGKQTLHLHLPPGVRDGTLLRFHLGPAGHGLIVLAAINVV